MNYSSGEYVFCEQCERLWKAYEFAVFEHVHLSGRLRLADAIEGAPDCSDLVAEVTEAAKRRELARERLLVHESEEGHGS